MGLQFEWTVDDVEIEPESPPKRWLGRAILLFLTLCLLLIQTPFRHKLTFAPTITFAVPASQLNHFRPLATNFMQQHPESEIIIVSAADFADPVAMLMAADAAVHTPDVSLLEKGMFFPLDELTVWNSDFYEQSRSGVTWDEQLWVWPYALQMNMLYSDTFMRGQTSLQPIETWNFLQFGRQINLLADQNDIGFLLSTRDILFSYAYAQDTSPLEEAMIDETLAWVSQLNTADNALLDLSGLQPTERQRTHLKNVSAQRTVAIWSDTPSRYEYLTQLNNVTITPWPQSDTEYKSVAPLRVHGGVISATTQNPPLAMAWLDFLSQQPPPTGERLIPVRQSIAETQNYWDRLPQTLSIQMNTAFDTAQAISISDHSALSWKRINRALTQ